MTTERFMLGQNDWVPNNPHLPVIVYRHAVDDEGDAAAERFEALFEAHGWPSKWRDTVFDYHHYHSTAHEVLGVTTGSAELILGGPQGRAVRVEAGDALLLPVGTGHCRRSASADFMVVGAYPDGQDWDICREAPSEQARARIASLPPPERDPVVGDWRL